MWANIVVEVGSLEYTLDSPRRTFLLTAERPGVAPPTEPHHVKVVGLSASMSSFCGGQRETEAVDAIRELMAALASPALANALA